jgi:hypothetical protein
MENKKSPFEGGFRGMLNSTKHNNTIQPKAKTICKRFAKQQYFVRGFALETNKRTEAGI